MTELLLEIGTEEIPADYLYNGLAAFKDKAAIHLQENRIGIRGELITYGTPRRLVLIGRGLAEMQEDVVREISGPPRRVAFDEQGNPTKAAYGFARKQGVRLEDLRIRTGPKGEYVFVEKKTPGRPTVDVLAEMLPVVIRELPWPKSMRWGSVTFSFVRPIHWILAVFGGRPVEFEVAGIRSGRLTRGHRFMNPSAIEVRGSEDYLRVTREAGVIVDPRQREEAVKQAVSDAVAGIPGKPVLDEELISRVSNMVELPSAVCGSFDEVFLELPDPVLVTPMREHQRYFAVRDEAGQLMNYFVAVNNTRARDEGVVRRGHERVLRARLSDARFFFNEDRKHSLASRLEDLKGVIYQSELGTSYAKVRRFTRLAEYLSGLIAPHKMEQVRLAASLCKCDLVTEMVMEFPSLQGVMGRVYAQLDGHPEEVCTAVEEHYLPARSGGELPASVTGAIVGAADRMDTITGFFAAGLEPTGTADPFALRRHALALIRILEDRQWDVSLGDLIRESCRILAEEISFDRDQVSERIEAFFRERYRNMMLGADYEHDLVDSVISARFDRIHRLRPRIEQLKAFSAQSGDFQALVHTFKRIANIVKGRQEIHRVDPSLFREPCEKALWVTYEEIAGELPLLLEAGRDFDALKALMRLKAPVDEFFERVEILSKEDPRLQENRVAMLQALTRLFLELADLSRFSI